MKSKQNILFITSWFPSKANSTLGNFVKWHALALSLYSNISIIYVAKLPHLKSKFVSEKETLNNLDISIMYYKGADTGVNTLNKIINSVNHFRAYQKLFTLVKPKPDMVHANIVWPIGMFALWLKFRYKLNFILTEHWSALSKKENFNFLKRTLIRIIFKNADFIIPVSESLKNDIKKWNDKLAFKVIPNIVNTEYFYFKEKTLSNIYKWAHISTLEPVKNVEGIILAFSKLIHYNSNNHLSIISDGNYSSIKKLISELKIPDKNIRLIGTSTNQDVANLLRNSDACIQFSRSETFGIVAAEALCTGTPLLSTKVGFLDGFFEEEIGLFVESENTEELFRKMKLMPDLKFDKLKSSIYFSSLFKPKKISQTYSEIYRKFSNTKK